MKNSIQSKENEYVITNLEFLIPKYKYEEFLSINNQEFGLCEMSSEIKFLYIDANLFTNGMFFYDKNETIPKIKLNIPSNTNFLTVFPIEFTDRQYNFPTLNIKTQTQSFANIDGKNNFIFHDGVRRILSIKNS